MKFTIKKDKLDILFAPITYLAAIWLIRVRGNIRKMRISKKILLEQGVFPILDTYWEPLFNPARLRYSLRKDRDLPGIDFNDKEQIEILAKFKFNEELVKFPIEKSGESEFYYRNGSFDAGDAEYLYNIIRLFKPKRVFEIGSGNSTLMVINALNANRKEDAQYKCEHVCIEPYECKWLDKLPIRLIRKKVEDVGADFFRQLERNDLLFIDSSHIIRPQGDIIVEFLEILPILKPGTLVHFHDIFTPKDYWDDIILEDVRFWNEQYLLEAFLTFNKEYKIIGAVNYLMHHYRDKLMEACPILKEEKILKEPGSFYIARR